jgi:hypothetical protein
LDQVWGVVDAVSAWPGIVISQVPDGLCLRLGGLVLGRLRWNGRVDVPVGAEMRDRLVAEGMAARDPDDVEAERVVFAVRTAADVDRAVWLLRLAYLGVDSNTKPIAMNGGC